MLVLLFFLFAGRLETRRLIVNKDEMHLNDFWVLQIAYPKYRSIKYTLLKIKTRVEVIQAHRNLEKKTRYNIIPQRTLPVCSRRQHKTRAEIIHEWTGLSFTLS